MEPTANQIIARISTDDASWEERQTIARRVAVLDTDFGINDRQADNDRNVACAGALKGLDYNQCQTIFRGAVAIMTARYGKHSVLDLKNALSFITAFNTKYPAE